MQEINKTKPKYSLPAFTLVELIITITVLAILAGIVTFTATTFQKTTRDSSRDAKVRILSSALEKYYRDNGEYPSVALMTSTNVDTIQDRLGITDEDIFKFPNSPEVNSIATSNPSATTLVYSANTTDTTKNTQCQTDTDGYCDGFTLQYVKEVGGTAIAKSLNSTFEAIVDSDTCNEGDTQNGSTCTHTYTATYQAGAYTCPSGGTLSGTTCTNTYSASYSNGTTYYYCPNGGSISGFTCTTTSSYPATAGTSYQCPSGYSWWPGANYPLCGQSYSATYQAGGYSCPNGGSLSGTTCTMSRPLGATQYICPHNNDSGNGFSCRHNRPAYGTKAGCNNAGYQWDGSCYNMHAGDPTPNYLPCPSGWSQSATTCSRSATYSSSSYTCPSGGTLIETSCWKNGVDANQVTVYSCPSGSTVNGSTCTTTSTYPASSGSYSGYYYCSGGGTLSGTTCTNSYAATQSAGYYTCPNGGVASGTTCTYTYELEG